MFSVQFGLNLVGGQLMLLPYSCLIPAPSLLLACSWPTPAMLLLLATPVRQPSSSALYNFFRHGDSRLLWYLKIYMIINDVSIINSLNAAVIVADANFTTGIGKFGIVDLVTVIDAIINDPTGHHPSHRYYRLPYQTSPLTSLSSTTLPDITSHLVTDDIV